MRNDKALSTTLQHTSYRTKVIVKCRVTRVDACLQVQDQKIGSGPSGRRREGRRGVGTISVFPFGCDLLDNSLRRARLCIISGQESRPSGRARAIHAIPAPKINSASSMVCAVVKPSMCVFIPISCLLSGLTQLSNFEITMHTRTTRMRTRGRPGRGRRRA